MAIMNTLALEIIKEKFEDREFIINKGIVYKIFSAHTIQLDRKKISKSKIINIIKSNDEIIENGDLLSLNNIDLKTLLGNNNYIIEDDKLYKKYGGTDKRGYVQFSITIDGTLYYTHAHRIIYYIHYGIWDETKVINHLDGNKSNNLIENLELVTQFDNIIYSIRNNEIIFEPQFIDEITKKKYRLNDKGWEIFKKEAYDGYKRHTLSSGHEGDAFYETCKISNSIEEFNDNIYKYFERIEKEEKKAKRKNKKKD